MLDKTKAKRKEYHTTQSGRKLLVYVFDCNCGQEIKPRVEQLKTATGKCLSCSHKLRENESRYNALKIFAKARNIDVNISFEHYSLFTKQTYCSYCGDSINWNTSINERGGKAIYLDRIDSKKGYSYNNCNVCCSVCNRMKMDMSLEDFLEKCNKISDRTYSYRKIKNV